MKYLLSAVAALPFLGGLAIAEPTQTIRLDNDQMDTVTAGWSVHETEVSNTSWTQVSVYDAPLTACSECYLVITSDSISVESKFGPGAPQ
ncbi:MAG TPA: hypothetical protein VKZ79_01420 [Alphaproteobacteria bacterium]|nr:hypothetical protein [Alphaproteobacteria bacterium]